MVCDLSRVISGSMVPAETKIAELEQKQALVCLSVGHTACRGVFGVSLVAYVERIPERKNKPRHIKHRGVLVMVPNRSIYIGIFGKFDRLSFDCGGCRSL